ncbi:ABC transporter substrate-binding protein [Paenibacillus beijingensis]|uniref:ABC transporter substrate-binding protein n=1 Tax=Paenibacillus beijingensis TaxID=1126833 RepID=A0A0D5NMG7_9BACL|nr:ABC transporter substrate-binding protein [Paenibacillus beijingensis]AJY76471.1 ABC transporter substrate-binding protein [Paenibacillus beijingensis]
MMVTMKRSAVVMISMMMLLFAAACGSGGTNETATTNTPAPATEETTSPPANETGAEAAPQEITTVKFSEVIRSIFYAPHYVAMSKGFFEEEGLNVDMNTSQGSDKGAAALLAGTADISLVGPETAIFIHNQEGNKKLKIFYQLTMKDGSFLLSRTKADSFKWSDLSGKTVISWRPGSAPQMVFSSTLKQEGVADANVITNIAAPAMAAAFTGGQGDYIQVFEPLASTLINEGKAYYAASMGETFGSFPETSYVATSEYIEKNPAVIQKFVNAVAKGREWLNTASDDEIAEALAPFFEGTSKELIIQSVNRYKQQDTWPAKPELTAEAFEKLQGVLIENGVLKPEQKIANMTDVVDMTFVGKIGQ